MQQPDAAHSIESNVHATTGRMHTLPLKGDRAMHSAPRPLATATERVARDGNHWQCGGVTPRPRPTILTVRDRRCKAPALYNVVRWRVQAYLGDPT